MSNCLFIHGDARRLPLPDESVQCVIADPPYGARRPSARRLAHERFDEIEGNKRLDGRWIREAWRVLKNNCALYVCGCWDKLDELRYFVASSGFKIRSCIVWDKMIHGLADLATCWAPRHEMVLFASKGRHELVGNRPIDVIRVQRVDSAKLVHPYQKPAKLFVPMIEASTNPGDTILDPFAGSGSISVACEALGRHCIGLDLDRDYLKIAKHRIDHPNRHIPRPGRIENHPLFDRLAGNEA